MKKTLCLLLAVIMLLSLCACKNKVEEDPDKYASVDDVTVESILEMTKPIPMMNNMGGFRMEIRNDDPFNAGADASTTTLVYVYKDAYAEINQMADYDSGTYAHIYYTANPNDPYLYYVSNDGAQVLNMTQDELEESLTQSMFGLEYYTGTITERGSDGTNYLVTVDCTNADDSGEDVLICTYDFVIEPATGYVQSATAVYYDSDGNNSGATTISILYSSNLEIDMEPRELAIAAAEEEAANAETDSETEDSSSAVSSFFSFAAHDLDGNLVSNQDIAGAKLVIINYWDPSSEECMEEMPDLRVLYDDYKDQGLAIIGVISESASVEDAKAIVEEYALDYPIVIADTNLAMYVADYYPTTYLFDEEGEMIGDQPYIGAQTYEDWTQIVSEQLNGSTETTEE